MTTYIYTGLQIWSIVFIALICGAVFGGIGALVLVSKLNLNSKQVKRFVYDESLEELK